MKLRSAVLGKNAGHFQTDRVISDKECTCTLPESLKDLNPIQLESQGQTNTNFQCYVAVHVFSGDRVSRKKQHPLCLIDRAESRHKILITAE